MSDQPQMENPTSVMGSQFVTTSPLDLIITTKTLASKDSHFVVADINGNVVFKLKSSIFGVRGTLLLLDAAGNPLVTLRQKRLSNSNRWKAYRGDSTSDRDLLFSVKKSSSIQWKTKLDVFLAVNTNENLCDFHIKGSWPSDSSCDIYLRDSPQIVAQMQRKTSIPSPFIGKETFMVAVFPNVDYAFIVALVVIVNQR